MARGDFIAGRFEQVPAGAADGEVVSVSPRKQAEVVGRHPFALRHVGEAVDAARAAFPGWALRPLAERCQAMHALKNALAALQDRFVEALVHEVGKPRWEARGEVAAALKKIDVTLDEGLPLVADVQLEGRRARYSHRPHGVAAVIGPFNFPLHLVHGHVVPALVTGNTVVVKPSEQAPGIGALYAEAFEAAGLPPGVFNLVHGDGRTGARLSGHAGVDAVLFTGGYATGQAIRRATLDQPGKLLALEMGGRNPALVLADAPLEKAVHDVLWGAFVTAGQRCSGTAWALVERGCIDAFRARLRECVQAMVVGDPARDDVFMGPLIDEAARDRFEARVAAAEAAGIEAWIEGKRPEVFPEGAYAGPAVHFAGDADPADPALQDYLREELFGPDLLVESIADLDEALWRANDNDYGLSASVFTCDPARFAHALPRLRYGCVNWNAPTCGASARLPFGGLGKSGNHRPAALWSTLYSTYPVSTLEGATELDTAKLSPGLRGFSPGGSDPG